MQEAMWVGGWMDGWCVGLIQTSVQILIMIPMIYNTSKVVRCNYRFPCVRMISLYLKCLADVITGYSLE